MTKESLQFWHAELNKLFFNGELEPAIIQCWKIPPEDNENQIEAQLVNITNPFIIQFYFDIENENFLYTITVLLHEMVHQYCAEQGIEDMSIITDKHTRAFKKAAEKHGLIQGGYALNDEAKTLIENRAKAVENVASLPSLVGRRSIWN